MVPLRAAIAPGRVSNPLGLIRFVCRVGKGFPWFWLTSPLPPGVRWVLSSRSGSPVLPMMATWASSGIESITIPSQHELAQPTLDSLLTVSPFVGEVAGLLKSSRGGRTVEELAELIPNATVSDLESTITSLNPYLDRIEQQRLRLAFAEEEVAQDFEIFKRLADWLSTKSRQSDSWLWEYPWLLFKLGKRSDIALLLEDPVVTWRLWSSITVRMSSIT